MRISFWKHHPVSDQIGSLLAQETIEEQHKFHYDFVKLTPAGSWLATCYGVKDEWQNDFLGRRTISDRIIHQIEDWLSLSHFTNLPQALKEQLYAAKITCKQIQNVPVYATVFCPLTQAFQCAGLATLKEHLKSDKAKVLSALNVITDNTIQVMRAFKEQGIRGMYFVTQSMQPDIFSKEEYDEIGKPFDALCLRAAANFFEDVIFHLHGENIYLSIEEGIAKLQLHYGLSNNNPNYISLKTQSAYPIIPGIPANKIIAAKSKEEIQKVLEEISGGEEISMITCACVLPLDTGDEVIKNWLSFAKYESGI